MTLAIDHTGTTARERRRSHATREVKWHSWSFRLFLAGMVALIVSAWGGIVPFVGPTFGFSADGTGSWYWDLSHALLALIPGAVGCLVGITLMGYSAARSRTSVGLGLIGVLAVASGAWFAIGPLAWPVLYGTKAYFLNASPLRELAYVVGYALGPGLILAVVGGIAWGSETVAPGYAAETSQEVAPAGVSTVRPAPVPEAAPAAATATPATPPLHQASGRSNSRPQVPSTSKRQVRWKVPTVLHPCRTKAERPATRRPLRSTKATTAIPCRSDRPRRRTEEGRRRDSRGGPGRRARRRDRGVVPGERSPFALVGRERGGPDRRRSQWNRRLPLLEGFLSAIPRSHRPADATEPPGRRIGGSVIRGAWD